MAPQVHLMNYLNPTWCSTCPRCTGLCRRLFIGTISAIHYTQVYLCFIVLRGDFSIKNKKYRPTQRGSLRDVDDGEMLARSLNVTANWRKTKLRKVICSSIESEMPVFSKITKILLADWYLLCCWLSISFYVVMPTEWNIRHFILDFTQEVYNLM